MVLEYPIYTHSQRTNAQTGSAGHACGRRLRAGAGKIRLHGPLHRRSPPGRDDPAGAAPPRRRRFDMKPISTSTLGMSAAFSTTKPAWRAGFCSSGKSWPNSPTTLRAMRAEPTRVSCRTRLARMRATSGGALRTPGRRSGRRRSPAAPGRRSARRRRCRRGYRRWRRARRGRRCASACIDTNNAAPLRWAIATRSSSGMNTSLVAGQFHPVAAAASRNWRCNSWAVASATCFS